MGKTKLLVITVRTFTVSGYEFGSVGTDIIPC